MLQCNFDLSIDTLEISLKPLHVHLIIFGGYVRAVTEGRESKRAKVRGPTLAVVSIESIFATAHLLFRRITQTSWKKLHSMLQCNFDLSVDTLEISLKPLVNHVHLIR